MPTAEKTVRRSAAAPATATWPPPSAASSAFSSVYVNTYCRLASLESTRRAQVRGPSCLGRQELSILLITPWWVGVENVGVGGDGQGSHTWHVEQSY